jgi:translation initiation factor 2 subunit 1
MVFRRKDYPESGEFVIATAVKLQDHGVYVNLDEYGKGGYIPIGEVASTWVKNIRDFVKEGQKLVLKVIRVDDRKGHVDLSIRKVTEREKKDKLIQYKKSKKAEKLLEGAGKALNKKYDEAVSLVGLPLEDHYGDLYAALEAASVKGPTVFTAAGIPDNWAKALYEISKDHVEPPVVQVAGVIQISSSKPKGVEDIKKAIAEGRKASAGPGIKVEITYVGAPRYRIEVTAKDYKAAEDSMKQAVDTMTDSITSAGGSATFVR